MLGSGLSVRQSIPLSSKETSRCVGTVNSPSTDAIQRKATLPSKIAGSSALTATRIAKLATEDSVRNVRPAMQRPSSIKVAADASMTIRTPIRTTKIH